MSEFGTLEPGPLTDICAAGREAGNYVSQGRLLTIETWRSRRSSEVAILKHVIIVIYGLY
jgi:hypothetical protein